MAEKGSVFYGETGYRTLFNHLRDNKYSKTFILVDGNTHLHCLSQFLSHFENTQGIEIIEIESGENHKNLETCSGIWNALSELGADRKSILINLGGGVVTDIGGFIASTFKRGIAYINVPTSLLAMVDASVGGKTGIDLGNLKNQIGVINNPQLVLIDAKYLATLPKNEMRSGLAEILKHGLINDESYWVKVSNLESLILEDLEKIIQESVNIKSLIVKEDPYELGLRKTLNYGHTLGHAIESYFLTHPKKSALLHGEAVAIGMVLATYLSKELKNFPEDKLETITLKINKIYPKIHFEKKDKEAIIELLKFDKKNESGKINFVLLEDIGQPVIDCQVPKESIYNSFQYYESKTERKQQS